MRESIHELLVYAVSHPLGLLFAEATRRLGDVVDVPMVGRVVNSPALARAILLDGEHFSKSGPGSFGVVVTQVMGDNALINMDGEPHLRLRGKLHDLFSHAYLQIVESDVLAEPVAQLGDRLVKGETVDLVRFSQVLSGRTIYHMLGFEKPDRNGEDQYLEVFGLTRLLTDSIGLSTRRLSEAQVSRKRAVFDRLMVPVADAYSRDKFPERSVLARLRELGLTADETKGVVAAILIAGTEAVTTAIPRTVALLIDSGQQTALRADARLRQAAIDEALRFVVPSPVMVRSVAADVTIDGVRFVAGDRVLLLTYNLVKERSLYPRPRHFDIRRPQPAVTRNLWFGAGHHFCLGFALAQRELRLVLGVLSALPGELTVARRSYAHGTLLPGYSRLEVRLR